jgi:hypothetical protein
MRIVIIKRKQCVNIWECGGELTDKVLKVGYREETCGGELTDKT